MISGDDSELLLACLAVLLRRASGPIVLEEAQVRAALDAPVELTHQIVWEHDKRSGTIRISLPPKEAL